jgi:hypothetical protein
MNYAATKAFNLEQIFEDAIRQEMELDTIKVECSPLCRPESDRYNMRARKSDLMFSVILHKFLKLLN